MTETIMGVDYEYYVAGSHFYLVTTGRTSQRHIDKAIGRW